MGEVHDASRPGVGEEQYRIPKIVVPVRVVLDGGTVVEGSVYLRTVAEAHAGRQKVVDLLTSPEKQFFPVCTEETVRLVHQTRIAVAWIEEPEDADSGAILDELDLCFDPVFVAVELELAGMPREMARMKGQLRLVMPPGHQRVLDFLNLDEPFFSVETDRGTALVNKRYVLDLWQI